MRRCEDEVYGGTCFAGDCGWEARIIPWAKDLVRRLDAQELVRRLDDLGRLDNADDVQRF
ncbi:MAG: hypothetical protein QJR01_08135 [Kyrpidia sp.]|nr:hypothetical protein [Kyrpidia sp.]